MRANSRYLLPALCMILYLADCKQAYEPPAIKAVNNYLVVDGLINIGTNAVTTINLNRTRNLSDTTKGGIPELNAQVSIESGNGSIFPLQDTANNGVYTSQVLNLDDFQQYRIAVTTHDGRKYASDLVACKPTPSIDSVSYEQPFDLTFYVTTHDPSKKTGYYRWDYTETWEHDSQFQTVWGVKNGLIFVQDSANQNVQCWTTLNSTNILVGNSTALSQDLVDRFPIYTIPNGDIKLNMKYSILVRQYALTEDAYNYWQLIQKTSQGLGTLFDLQPTQLIGNIHCTTNPNEHVIGFISATSIQQKRLFLFQSSLHDWMHNSLGYSCDTLEIPVDQTDYRIYTYPDTNFAPYYFITNGPLVLASRICLDCTLLGGNTIKPPYWQ